MAAAGAANSTKKWIAPTYDNRNGGARSYDSTALSQVVHAAHASTTKKENRKSVESRKNIENSQVERFEFNAASSVPRPPTTTNVVQAAQHKPQVAFLELSATPII